MCSLSLSVIILVYTITWVCTTSHLKIYESLVVVPYCNLTGSCILNFQDGFPNYHTFCTFLSLFHVGFAESVSSKQSEVPSKKTKSHVRLHPAWLLNSLRSSFLELSGSSVTQAKPYMAVKSPHCNAASLAWKAAALIQSHLIPWMGRH